MRRIASLLFTNGTLRQILFKNTFWLAVADGLSRLVKFAVTIYIIRTVGGFEYGKFAFAFSFMALFSNLFDFGMSSIVTREFAKSRDEEKNFAALLALKLFLGVPIICLIGVSGVFATSDGVIRLMIVILALSLWINEYGTTYYAFFRARQCMEYESWSAMMGAIGLAAGAMVLMWLLRSIEALSYSYLVSSVVVLVGVAALASLKHFPLVPRPDPRAWRRYLGMATPIAMVGVVSSVYRFSDSVMLGWLGQIEETGFYNAALRIVGLAIIPMNLVLPVFLPALSSEASKPGERLQRLFEKQVEIMIFAAFMITAIIFPLAPRIVDVAFTTSFSPAATALQISIFTAFFLYLWSPYNQVLIVCNQQSRVFLIHLVGAAVNVTLNLALIPHLSLYGASIASVVSEFVIFALLFAGAMRHSPIVFSADRLAAVFIPAVLSGAFIGTALYMVSGSGLGFLASAIVGGAIAYSGCFFVVRGLWTVTPSARTSRLRRVRELLSSSTPSNARLERDMCRQGEKLGKGNGR